MRAVVQRVKRAQVEIEGRTVSSIESGMVVFLGVCETDEVEDVDYLAEKVSHLRFFDDPEGKMNCALNEVGGTALVVSNFTLYGDCRKGRRPSFTGAAGAKKGLALYEQFVQALRSRSVPVATGEFREYMQVTVQNDGPVTLLLDSKKGF